MRGKACRYARRVALGAGGAAGAAGAAGVAYVAADDGRRRLAKRGVQLTSIWAPTLLRPGPEAITASLEASGPVFIKLGQWLSSRRDLFSPELCDAMGVLHEHVAAQVCAADAQLADETAPGVTLGRLLGAGCIARVYEGRLEGRPVAVKVRRENVQEFMEIDLQFLKCAAVVAEAIWSELKWLMLDTALDDFGHYMISQVDFRNEAANLQRFAKNMTTAFAGVPAVYAAREDVLVMELIEGQSLSVFLQQKHSPEVMHKVWSLLGDQSAKMVLADNFMHADLHPGNIIVNLFERRSWLGRTTTEARLTFIDAGMCFEVPRHIVDYLKVALRGAIAYDADALGQAFVDMHRHEGLCPEAPASLPRSLGILGLCCVFTCEEAMWGQLFASRDEYLGARTPEYFHRMAGLFTANEVRVSPMLWSLLTSFALVEGSLHELGSRTNVLRMCLPYLVSSPMDVLQRVVASIRCGVSEFCAAA